MKFSIIYSVDIPKVENARGFPVPTVKLEAVAPPKFKRGTWKKTEGSDPTDSEFNHAKWAGILDKKQFETFLETNELFAESTETMGSIGAPGFGFGWAPAISFSNRDNDYFGNAYVTPMPSKPNGEPIRKNGATERDWDRLKKVIVAKYGA